MRPIGLIIGLILLIVFATGAIAMPNADFYVSVKGNDAWSGKLSDPNETRTDGPFATIERARKAVRALRSDGIPRRITVLIRGGTYTISKPLVFTPEDSGTKRGPITYAAYPGEKPIISGGRRITGWKKAGDGLWTVDVPTSWYFRDLYVNGERRSRPRLPKEGFFYIVESLGQDVHDAFRYAEGDVKPWQNLDDVEIIAFNAWDELRFHIASIDEKARIITFTGANNWPFGAWGQNNARYYAENVLEAFDSPGQWYLDRKTGVLSYRPLPGEDMKKAEVIAPTMNQLLRVEGDPAKQNWVENLHLRGLGFRYAGWDLPKESYISIQAAVKIGGVIWVNGARHCSIQDCDISRVGQYGIDLAGACQNNLVKGNTIHDMGAGGIKLGSGDHNQLTRNHIYDLGHTYLSAVGIWVGNSGHNLIARNHIHDLNYTGISVGWSWGYGPTLTVGNIIEHNHIHDIGRGLLSDMGGIYTLGLAPESVIRYNLIHDVQSFSYGGWGIYLDEGTSGMLVENNIVYRTRTGGFHQHYGKDNVIRNNIFAFAKEGQIQRSRPEEHISFTFEHNIVYWSEGPLFHGKWDDGHFNVDNNIYWHTDGPPFDSLPGTPFEKWQEMGHDQHSVIADPMFADPRKGDFTLLEDSPAPKLGFKPIVGAGD